MPRTGPLLAASLLLNLFTLGALVGGGAMLAARPAGVWHRPAPGRPIRQAGDALPPPERALFRATLRVVVVRGHDLEDSARQNRREAARLFAAPRFDAQAVDAALARARDAEIAMRGRLETAATAFAADLPADQRALLARGLAQAGPLR